MKKQSWWQQEQARLEKTREKSHHGQSHPTENQAAAASAPSWLVELIDILEAIWATLPASQSEPNHPVTLKLRALKAQLPK